MPFITDEDKLSTALLLLTIPFACALGYWQGGRDAKVDSAWRIPMAITKDCKAVKQMSSSGKTTTSRSTTTEKKPDGSVITTETQTESNESKVDVKLAPRSKYSLALSYSHNLDEISTFSRQFDVRLGRRLWDSDWWTEAGYNSEGNSVQLGIRVER